MIPKVIHYCWFGRNEKNKAICKCIDSWKKYCPDYTIIEWNEDNFDVESVPFVRDAYKAKKWAFVADYARLKIVYENGGIYLDTDVELLKSLDPFLNLNAYMGFESDGLVNTGLGFGARKGHEVLLELMKDYEARTFSADMEDLKKIACPIINTKVLENLGLEANGKQQSFCDLTVFPYEYFDPKDQQTYVLSLTDKTVSIHHYDASWKSANTSIKQALFRTVAKIVGKDNFIKIKNTIKRNK